MTWEMPARTRLRNRRRVSAVLQLRYQDLKLAKTAAAPYGAIAWPGETDKMGKAWSAPINAAVRAALDAALAERQGLGNTFLFPSPGDAAKPVHRWLAAKGLRRPERLAKVPKQGFTLPRLSPEVGHRAKAPTGSGRRAGGRLEERVHARDDLPAA